MILSDHDKSTPLHQTLRDCYNKSTNFYFIPRLVVAMLRTQPFEAFVIVFYTVAEGVTRIALPVVLYYFLSALQSQSNADNKNTAYMWAGILGGLGCIQTVIHHVLFFYSMRIGWNWKNACTAMIYSRLFQLNGSVVQLMHHIHIYVF